MTSKKFLGVPPTDATADAQSSLRVFELACRVTEYAVPPNQLPGLDAGLELETLEETTDNNPAADSTDTVGQMVAIVLGKMSTDERQPDAGLLPALKRPRHAL